MDDWISGCSPSLGQNPALWIVKMPTVSFPLDIYLLFGDTQFNALLTVFA